jgi:ABC-2 type transport system permease protein
MNTLVGQIKLEFKLFLREKEALFWTLAFPVFMIVLFGLLWKDETWDGIPTIAYLLPGIIVMAVMTTCIVSTATGVVEEREKGIFRRLSLTPLKRQTLIGGQIVNRYLTVLAQTTILIAIGIAFFGAAIEGNLLLFWAVLTLGTISFLALGFALAALIKNEKSAHPLSMIVFFTLMFLGGCFFPIDQMPEFLRPVCEALPSLQLNDALRMIVVEEVGIIEVWREIPVLLGWLAGCSILAVKFFRWE